MRHSSIRWTLMPSERRPSRWNRRWYWLVARQQVDDVLWNRPRPGPPLLRIEGSPYAGFGRLDRHNLALEQQMLQIKSTAMHGGHRRLNDHFLAASRDRLELGSGLD